MIFQNWWSTQTGSLSVKKETLELLKTYIFLREALKKNSKKSDIVTIRSGTYLPYLNSDIKFSDICSKTFYLPTLRK